MLTGVAVSGHADPRLEELFFVAITLLLNGLALSVQLPLAPANRSSTQRLREDANYWGLKQLLMEWGQPCSMVLQGDSAACKGTLSRDGSGRQKHLELRQLWLQGHIKDGSLEYEKIPREGNIADVLTKHWNTDAHPHFSRASFTPIRERVL